MGLGSLLFRRIGALVRWAFIGFKGSWNNILEGPKTDDPADGWAYDIVSNVIGLITIVLLALLFTEL